jgi:hypothetical protein
MSCCLMLLKMSKVGGILKPFKSFSHSTTQSLAAISIH